MASAATRSRRGRSARQSGRSASIATRSVSSAWSSGTRSGGWASQVSDATGLIVAPGFIDVHVHSELARLGGIDQFAGVLDGVTTELTSPDGFSWAPLPRQRLREVKDYLQVFYGDPDIGWDWSTVADYLSIFRGRIPNNLAPQAPHLAIKVAAMGWDGGDPTTDQLAAMKRALPEWLDAGGVGMAPGLDDHAAALSSRS